jgi:hypothetical protein
LTLTIFGIEDVSLAKLVILRYDMLYRTSVIIPGRPGVILGSFYLDPAFFEPNNEQFSLILSIDEALKKKNYGSKFLSYRVCHFEPSYLPLAKCTSSGSPKWAILGQKRAIFGMSGNLLKT